MLFVDDTILCQPFKVRRGWPVIAVAGKVVGSAGVDGD